MDLICPLLNRLLKHKQLHQRKWWPRYKCRTVLNAKRRRKLVRKITVASHVTEMRLYPRYQERAQLVMASTATMEQSQVGNGPLVLTKEISKNENCAVNTRYDSSEEALVTTKSVITNGVKQTERKMSSVTVISSPPDAEETKAAKQRLILHGSWELEKKIGETGPGRLRGPRGIVVTHNGDLAVAHKLSHRFVCVFGSSGVVKFNLDTKLYSNQSVEPWDVVVSSDGVYYITDKTPHVKMFHSTNGSYIGEWVTKSPPTRFTIDISTK